jgi:hypothetical protein
MPAFVEQAVVAAQLVTRYLAHLPFAPSELQMLPAEVFDGAMAEFERCCALSAA